MMRNYLLLTGLFATLHAVFYALGIAVVVATPLDRLNAMATQRAVDTSSFNLLLLSLEFAAVVTLMAASRRQECKDIQGELVTAGIFLVLIELSNHLLPGFHLGRLDTSDIKRLVFTTALYGLASLFVVVMSVKAAMRFKEE